MFTYSIYHLNILSAFIVPTSCFLSHLEFFKPTTKTLLNKTKFVPELIGPFFSAKYHTKLIPYLSMHSEGTGVLIKVYAKNTINLACILDIGSMCTDGQAHQVLAYTELLGVRCPALYT